MIGVIGSGSFGTAIANLLAEKNETLWYARRAGVLESIKQTGKNRKQMVNPAIKLTNELSELCEKCDVIFPVVPSSSFRNLMQTLSPILKPSHILIHATKGFDILSDDVLTPSLDRSAVKTMSEVMLEETGVLRGGAISGPNLARELSQHQPAATVIASRFNEVNDIGQKALETSYFKIFQSQDIKGIEIAGALKNYIGIASGICNGLELGQNSLAMLITRGMGEMIYFGKRFGSEPQAFLGIAGIGDLIATCCSPLSRNYSVGYRLAKGEPLEQIISEMEEVAEGVKTVQIVKYLADRYRITAPIAQTLFQILFEHVNVKEGIEKLLNFPTPADAEYV